MPQARSFGVALSQDNPEALAGSLAHVLRIEGVSEHVLGQAWTAGHNALVTCGHVVEPYLKSPASLVVRFPASGNRYAVQQVKVHPSYVRQPDGLVKFDVALLTVLFAYPESQAKPLPLAFEQQLETSQTLSTVRYPTHLGRLSAAPQPLSQEGHYLGQLRKHDSFHLLHDLALSPGDSGAPIFDGPYVVAIHCGDTATLPGLDVATTSIRLALWVDALRELGVKESQKLPSASARGRLAWAALAFVVGFTLSVLSATALLAPSFWNKWLVKQPAIMPVDISFNKPLNGFNRGDNVELVLTPRSDCWLYLFDIDEDNRVLQLYPPYGFPAFLKGGQTRTIDRFGRKLIKVNTRVDKLHLVALKSDYPIVNTSDCNPVEPAGQPLAINGQELAERIRGFKKADPQNILHLVMDAPRAK